MVLNYTPWSVHYNVLVCFVCNIYQYLHIPDMGWCHFIFLVPFCTIIQGTAQMPLNLLPKIPTLSCIFVLYNSFFVCVLYKRVVCVLYFSCCMKLSFFKLLFSAFLKLRAKRVLLGAFIFLSRVYPVIRSEERDPFWPIK